MYHSNLAKKNYDLVLELVNNSNLNKIQAERDGRGGIDFTFTPEIKNKIIKSNFIEILENIIEDIDIIWNINFTIISSNETLIEFDITEIRNYSEYDEIILEDSEFINQELIDYLSNIKSIDILNFETAIELRQNGNINDGFDVENFSFIMFDEENEIDLTDDETERIISNNIHKYIIIEYGDDEKNYELEYDQGNLTLEIIIENKTLILKPTNEL